MSKRFLSQTYFDHSYYKLRLSKKIKFNKSTCESTKGNIYKLEKDDNSAIIKTILRNEKRFPDIEGFPNLCELYIKDCKFTEIPDYVAYMIHLSKIKIQNTPITNISNCLKCTYNLSELILNNTKISCIIELPYSLKILRVNSSNLESIPECVYQSNLEELQISNSKITNISEKINDMYGLKILDLHGNGITSINVKFPSALNDVNLSLNKISEMEDDCFTSWGTLKNVDLSFNEISKIPTGLFKNKNLKYLNLSYNRLLEFDERLLDFNTLIVIDLSHNDINFGQIKKKFKDKSFIRFIIDGNIEDAHGDKTFYENDINYEGDLTDSNLSNYEEPID